MPRPDPPPPRAGVPDFKPGDRVYAPYADTHGISIHTAVVEKVTPTGVWITNERRGIYPPLGFMCRRKHDPSKLCRSRREAFAAFVRVCENAVFRAERNLSAAKDELERAREYLEKEPPDA